jgi:hypothetical protein
MVDWLVMHWNIMVGSFVMHRLVVHGLVMDWSFVVDHFMVHRCFMVH